MLLIKVRPHLFCEDELTILIKEWSFIYQIDVGFLFKGVYE